MQKLFRRKMQWKDLSSYVIQKEDCSRVIYSYGQKFESSRRFGKMFDE